MKKTKEDAQITFDNVLSAALKVFARKGYKSTTLDEIAKEASVTRGAVYWHFKNKHELFLYLVKKLDSRIIQRLNEIIETENSAIKVIKNLIKNYFYELENDEELRLFETIWLRSMDALHESEDFLNEQICSIKLFHDILYKIISKAKIETEAHGLNVEATTKILIGMITGIETIWLTSPDSFSIANEADAISSNFIRIFK